VLSRGPILLLALALGVQIAYANPGVVSAEFRAMTCCAHHCDEPLSLPSARACCGLTMTASGPAEAPLTGALAAPSAVAHAAPSLAPAFLASAQSRMDVVRPAGSGPPAFLTHRHLLI
jgi:hypothetical protein